MHQRGSSWKQGGYKEQVSGGEWERSRRTAAEWGHAGNRNTQGMGSRREWGQAESRDVSPSDAVSLQHAEALSAGPA